MAQTAVSQNLQFSIGPITYSAKAWGHPSSEPVLALHGWLDNCASFDSLAPLLSGCYVVAIDCAGHGKSSHRESLTAYSIWQDVGDIFRIADQLGWQQFHLLGHSRGAMMAFIAAGTIPERILSLNLLEGVYPQLAQAVDSPSRLRKAITELDAVASRPRRYYADFDRAAQARVKGLFPIAEEDAWALAKQGVAQDEQGYFWQYDVKLMVVSEVGFTAEQVDAFAKNITVRTTVFIAEDGVLLKDEYLKVWLQVRKHISVHKLPGNHHFHMHAQAGAIAEILNPLIMAES